MALDFESMMPLRETAFQGYTFLALCYIGLAACLLFDLLSPLFRSKQPVLRMIFDVFFSFLVAFGCFLALAVTHCGALRYYMGVALLAGALLYHFGLRRLWLLFRKIFLKNRNFASDSE